MYNLMWFRADLRIDDNPAFHHAMTAGPTIAIYALNPKTWQAHHLSTAKISLIVRQLFTLEKSLRKLNVPLFVINTREFKQVPRALQKFIAEKKVTSLYFNHEFEINERQLSRAVQQRLIPNTEIQSFNDQCAIAPGKITTATGDWYKVFTPFKRRYLADFHAQGRRLYTCPKPQAPLAENSDIRALSQFEIAGQWQKLWPAGEQIAHQRLTRFANDTIKDYARLRDFPSEPATSTLSPYLAIGALSTRQCLEAAIAMGGLEAASPANEGAATWVSELIWRDFYRHLIYAFPDLCKHRAFQANTEALPWRHDTALLDAWQQGRTGYPIVDAAMKQLMATGWMHNRLRMITAMFLTKHLFVDWRLGEDFFMRNLVDGDLASNNGGWQWSASTGVDAAPYFRIFNPARQSERFDPDGRFIKTHLPELQALTGKHIHNPTPAQADACGYPRAIVEHQEAVAQTKAWFKAVK